MKGVQICNSSELVHTLKWLQNISNHGIFNHELFMNNSWTLHELFMNSPWTLHELFDHELYNHEIFSSRTFERLNIQLQTLKVSKSRNQFIVSWILPKNKRNSLSWAKKMLRIVSRWENSEDHKLQKLFSKFTDL